MKHTPGKWFFVPMNADKHGIVTTPGYDILAEDGYSVVATAPRVAAIRKEADAQLIAAAPELLEALKDIEREYTALLFSDYANTINPDPSSKHNVIVAARAVVRRAEGKAE